ncbi:hypothetical protein I350_04571 [Cryptococcus amylolentus CBS 6273]|uniref:Uncharacterized protein n=1 Tax=Cryptococcus amylolentus CBS 6273 TaxID=1296118 RepID=A0A1E3JXF6_9TREE|nr:hypothetical protein I350_04571 [Cryptococcus amylolentus CBS 6273]
MTQSQANMYTQVAPVSSEYKLERVRCFPPARASDHPLSNINDCHIVVQRTLQRTAMKIRVFVHNKSVFTFRKNGRGDMPMMSTQLQVLRAGARMFLIYPTGEDNDGQSPYESIYIEFHEAEKAIDFMEQVQSLALCFTTVDDLLDLQIKALGAVFVEREYPLLGFSVYHKTKYAKAGDNKGSERGKWSRSAEDCKMRLEVDASGKSCGAIKVTAHVESLLVVDLVPVAERNAEADHLVVSVSSKFLGIHAILPRRRYQPRTQKWLILEFFTALDCETASKYLLPFCKVLDETTKESLELAMTSTLDELDVRGAAGVLM